ncbi:hypothetical protein IGI04_037301 [Brassica rapa subsp. trilocularis]|uniref:Uncharacterized protein n=1 Tax=Brassica rapa subsp. trilocularis TaxID=1813537 RepID=A0ABQ7LGY1_BRACM|nr:hypothetical protein IGI04_037301 [Brassica rapa subsp. trilocularis]
METGKAMTKNRVEACEAEDLVLVVCVLFCRMNLYKETRWGITGAGNQYQLPLLICDVMHIAFSGC